MVDKIDMMRKITAVRRRTRDTEVLDILAYAEAQLTAPYVLNPLAEGGVEIKQNVDLKQRMESFDRKTYMRDYMRKRRASKKDNG